MSYFTHPFNPSNSRILLFSALMASPSSVLVPVDAESQTSRWKRFAEILSGGPEAAANDPSVRSEIESLFSRLNVAKLADVRAKAAYIDFRSEFSGILSSYTDSCAALRKIDDLKTEIDHISEESRVLVRYSAQSGKVSNELLEQLRFLRGEYTATSQLQPSTPSERSLQSGRLTFLFDEYARSANLLSSSLEVSDGLAARSELLRTSMGAAMAELRILFANGEVHFLAKRQAELKFSSLVDHVNFSFE